MEGNINEFLLHLTIKAYSVNESLKSVVKSEIISDKLYHVNRALQHDSSVSIIFFVLCQFVPVF